MLDEGRLLEEAACGWQLPAYFGGTWSGLEDCLRTLELRPPAPTVTFITGSDLLVAASDELLGRLAGLLDDIGHAWADRDLSGPLPPVGYHTVFITAHPEKLIARITRLQPAVEIGRLII